MAAVAWSEQDSGASFSGYTPEIVPRVAARRGPRRALLIEVRARSPMVREWLASPGVKGRGFAAVRFPPHLRSAAAARMIK